jgi:HD-like signal output (HDOD) protein
MCDILAKEWRMQDHGAFTAGLLHDIGKSVLDQYFSDMFSAIQVCMRERSLETYEAERLLYGFDHADIGYWLSERWNLPVGLSEAIHYHHQPESAKEMPELTRLLHLGNNLSNEYAELVARGHSISDMGTDAEDESTANEKARLLLELDKRIKDSKIMDVLP